MIFYSDTKQEILLLDTYFPKLANNASNASIFSLVFCIWKYLRRIFVVIHRNYIFNKITNSLLFFLFEPLFNLYISDLPKTEANKVWTLPKKLLITFRPASSSWTFIHRNSLRSPKFSQKCYNSKVFTCRVNNHFLSPLHRSALYVIHLLGSMFLYKKYVTKSYQVLMWLRRKEFLT